MTPHHTDATEPDSGQSAVAVFGVDDLVFVETRGDALEKLRIPLRVWLRYDASNAKARARSTLLMTIHKHVRAVREARAALREKHDPLAPRGGERSGTRHRWRWARHRREYEETVLKPKREREAREKAVRADLLRAARAARSMGLDVEASRDRHGRVSSYYVRDVMLGWDGPKLRISDHDIPATAEREARSYETRGHSFDGGADIYASASPLRRPLWWKRALTLAMNRREVPGADLNA